MEDLNKWIRAEYDPLKSVELLRRKAEMVVPKPYKAKSRPDWMRVN